MHAAGLGDGDRFLDRFQHCVRFVADVSEVAGVMALDDAAERDHLGGLRVGAGRGEQPRREPERAGVECFLQQRDHLRQFVRRRRPIGHAHDHETERVVTDQHAGVHGGRGETVEVSGKGCFLERQPWRARAQIVAQELDLARQRRRDREAAMADDLGGHALAHLALGLGIDRQREVGMRLDVDEARRHRQSGGVDHFPRIVAEVGADGGDAALADREVAGPARGAGAVEQQPAADQDVMRHANSGYQMPPRTTTRLAPWPACFGPPRISAKRARVARCDTWSLSVRASEFCAYDKEPVRVQ